MAEKTEALNFMVSVTLKDRLRAYAAKHDLSISSAIRLLLTQSLDRAERASKTN